MALAKDVMTANPICLTSATTIPEAVEVFVNKKITSVGVYNTMGEVVGQLTELILVRILVLHQIQPEKYSKLAHCLDFLDDAVFVAPSDPITTVLKALMKSSSRRVLVRSEGRKIQGIISPKDILKTLMADSPDAKAVQNAVIILSDLPDGSAEGKA